VFNYVQQQSDIQLQASLDNNDFDESELLTIKVPLSVPYQNDQQNFERVDGELKLNGKIYKYVKRKISDGQLILLCLPDHNKMQLQSAKNEFFKYANDLVQNNHSKKSDHSKLGMFKNLTGEYICFTLAITAPVAVSTVAHVMPRQTHFLPSSPHSLPEQPPESI
jgi:hypothetical protein